MESRSYHGLYLLCTHSIKSRHPLPPIGFTTEEMGKDKLLRVTHVWVWNPTIETSGELSLNRVLGGGFDQPTIVTRQARPHKGARE